MLNHPPKVCVEFRVRPATRYLVTKFTSIDYGDGKGSAGSSVIGEFDNQIAATETCKALMAYEPAASRTTWQPHEPPPPAAPDA